MQDTLFVNQLFINIKKRIKPHWITAFVSGMIIGLLTYGYFMSNHFLTYDSMWNLYSDQNMINLGRQFLQYACGIGSYYDLPWLNGLLAIIYLSVTSVLVVEGLGIRSHINVVLTSGVLLTFPSVISTFCYTFTLDGYMMAALLAAAAFLVTDRKKWGFLAGIVFLGTSLGIYQAYLSFAIILCILRLLLDILDRDNIQEIIIKAIKYMVMGIGSYLFYQVTLNLMLKLQHVELSGYQGIDSIQKFSFSTLPQGFSAAFMNFLNFARWSNVLTTTDAMKIAFIALMLLGVAAYLYFFIINKRYKCLFHILLTIILVAAIPFGATAVNIISPDLFYHILLRYAWSLFFVFVLALSERFAITENKRLNRIKYSAVAAISIFSIILVFQFSLMANIVGFNMHERYEKTYALCVRILDRLEQTPGYEHGMPVAILGGGPDFPSTDITANDLVGYFGTSGDYFVNSTQKCAEFMSHYMNVTLETIEYSEELKLWDTEEYQNCPKFPNEGCIIQINGVWVVKLNG